VKVSVAVPQRLGADLVPHARLAEDLGFWAVYCFDHLVPVSDPLGPALEAAVALGAVAAATTRVVVGSLVLRVTLRPPEVTAGIAATLAAVAPGRASIGLGIGDASSAGELGRFGLPFPPLAARLDLLRATVDALGAVDVSVLVGGTHPAVVEVAQAVGAHNLWEIAPTDIGRYATAGVALAWAGRAAPKGGRPDLLADGADTIARLVGRLTDQGVDEVVFTPVPVGDPSGLAGVARAAGLTR